MGFECSYALFGEKLLAGRTGEHRHDGVRQQFTGKERDREWGLDYFDARYYSNVQSRFTSIDPLASSPKHTDFHDINSGRHAEHWMTLLRLSANDNYTPLTDPVRDSDPRAAAEPNARV